VRTASSNCAERFRQAGVDRAGYNTNESADDLEDLRKALGAQKISLWAISYGTHLSLATIKRHERNLDRVILAGTEGLTQTIKLPSNIQKHLEQIDRL
jgi:pimeloyl-ACP methyl ester carboxylesterase